MLKNVPIGCGQITWRGLPEEAALADIAGAGYAGAPAGPSRDRTAQETLALFEIYGLRPAPGYFAADFWKADEEAAILERARTFAAVSAAQGLTEMYVATGGFDKDMMASGRIRAAASGHVTPADGLSDADFGHFCATLNRVGEITLAEGVASCFHNHVGSVIETGEESGSPGLAEFARPRTRMWFFWGRTRVIWPGPARMCWTSSAAMRAVSKPPTSRTSTNLCARRGWRKSGTTAPFPITASGRKWATASSTSLRSFRFWPMLALMAGLL